MPRFICHGQNLYEEIATGRLFGRFHSGRSRSLHRLKSIKIREARIEIAHLTSEHAQSKLGLKKSPFTKIITVGQIINAWIGAGMLDLKLNAPKRIQITTSKANKLLEFFGALPIDQLTVGSCDRYLTWRKTKVVSAASDSGNAIVELELSLLSSILTWAVRSDIIPNNPIRSRPRYRKIIAHSTARMPFNDEQFHAIARYLFNTSRMESVAWFYLLAALTGCRSNELLSLRWDAKPNCPGWIDDKLLWVHRSKGGIAPYVLLDISPELSPLRDVLAIMKSRRTSERFIDNTSSSPLAHGLIRACKSLNIPRVAPHGLRAYHVKVLRSQGIDDSEIAKRLGHRSGVHLVERVYGTSEPGWFGSKKLDFLPIDNNPAWNI